MTQTVITPFYSATDTYTTTATGRTYSGYGPMFSFALFVKGTGAVATSWTVVVEGSYDGTNFDTGNPILTHTNLIPGDSAAFFLRSTIPYIAYRTRCTALVLGSATNIVCTLNTSYQNVLPEPKFSTITASSSGATTLISAVSGKKIRVVGYTLVSSGTVNVKFQSHVSPTDLTGLLYLVANTGAAPNNDIGQFETLIGEALDINLSGAIAVGGHLTYVLI